MSDNKRYGKIPTTTTTKSLNRQDKYQEFVNTILYSNDFVLSIECTWIFETRHSTAWYLYPFVSRQFRFDRIRSINRCSLVISGKFNVSCISQPLKVRTYWLYYEQMRQVCMRNAHLFFLSFLSIITLIEHFKYNNNKADIEKSCKYRHA